MNIINKNRNFLQDYYHYHFFYGGPLSNWASFSFTDNDSGVKYNCSEQFMMHKKALLFEDYINANRIMKSNNPGEQKALGRQVKNFDFEIWNEHARDIVYQGCSYKFSQNQSARDYLLGTEGQLLVEASPTDIIWGIGWNVFDEERLYPQKWRGTNWLGEVLTQLREDLQRN